MWILPWGSWEFGEGPTIDEVWNLGGRLACFFLPYGASLPTTEE